LASGEYVVIKYGDGVLEDIEGLPNDSLKKIAFYLLDDLARGRIRGKAL